MINCETYQGNFEDIEICNIVNDVIQELERARQKHPPQSSLHGAYAVILEEVRELEREIFLHAPCRANVKKEAIQVAATAIRLVFEHCDKRRKK